MPAEAPVPDSASAENSCAGWNFPKAIILTA